jgi:glycosyltransferase involved in cell wall biosynthesis
MIRVFFSHIASKNPFLSFGKAGKFITQELKALCESRTDLKWVEDPKRADLQVYLGIPHAHQEERWRRHCDLYIWFTMWESPEVPLDWVDAVNNADAACYPCQWVAEQYEKRGAKVPRFVVPLGVDTDHYRPRMAPKAEGEPFTFLWVGFSPGHINHFSSGKYFGDRKRGWLARAIFEELPIRNARLILKGAPWPNGRKNFKHITRHGNEIWELAEWLPENEMLSLMQSADAFVWPTWGEGFGMPPLEAAACGVPAIMPDYSALSDFFSPSWCYGLDYTVGPIWKTDLTGANIRPDALMKAMTLAYTDEGLRSGRARNARQVAEKWQWRYKTRPALENMIDRVCGIKKKGESDGDGKKDFDSGQRLEAEPGPCLYGAS